MTEAENTQAESAPSFDLHSVFNKKSEVDVHQVNQAPKKKDLVKKSEPVKVEAPIVEDEEDEDDSPTPDVSKAEAKSADIDYKAENERLQKTLKDTQKSFHEDRKKLAAYKKSIEKLKEEGSLLDEEATMLLDHTRFENEPEDEPLFVKYGKIWDKELEYMKKYAPNAKEIDQHILAFQHFMQTASPKEVHDTLADLSQYEEDEVEFTRQMLDIGRQYNDDIYADIHESGSIRNLKAKYSKKEDEMQKEIDKWEKKYNKLKEKYEDYNTESNLRLPSGSSNMDLPKSVTFDPKVIYGKQFQGR